MLKDKTKKLIDEELKTAPLHQLKTGISINLSDGETVISKSIHNLVTKSKILDRPEMAGHNLTHDLTDKQITFKAVPI